MKDLYDLTGYMDRNSKNGTHKFYIALVEKLLMQYKINIDLRYLIDLNGGAKRLSKNISTYSKKLSLLMQFINIIPFSMLSSIKMGYFVKVEFNAEVEVCRRNTKKKHWNMIIGTYDIVMICMSSVPSRIREGMVLLSGDVLLLFNPLQI